jgi:hypothetical protein
MPKPKKTAAAVPATTAAKPPGKLDTLAQLLGRPEGATLEAMTAATGWQTHSVRGAMAGALKKAKGLTITSEKTEAGRIYRASPGAAA